jgi:hypothetical protein
LPRFAGIINKIIDLMGGFRYRPEGAESGVDKRMVMFDGYDGEMRRERFAISGPSGRNSRAPWSECGQRTLWRGVTPVADLALLTTVTSRAEGP